MKSRIARTSSLKRGSARSSMRTGAGSLAHRLATGTTSTCGCSGVSAGRNQRNQMRPAAVPRRRHPVGVGRAPALPPRSSRSRPARTATWAPLMVHPFVVVVVRVQERVPQAHVPEGALGRPPADDHGLIVAPARRRPWRRRRRRPPSRRSPSAPGTADRWRWGLPAAGGRCWPARAPTSSWPGGAAPGRRRRPGRCPGGSSASMCHFARRPLAGSSR